MAAKKTKKKAVSKSSKASPKKSATKATKSKNTQKTLKKLAAPKTSAKPTKTDGAKKVLNSTLVPSRDGVLIERSPEIEMTAGGLYIPTTALEKPLKGHVISVGRGKFSKKGKFRPLDVKPGDEVLIGKYSGTELKIDGKEYLLVREEEILGVLS